MNQDKGEHRWSATRTEAIELFAGETPGGQLEQDIITHFVDDPERVLRAIHRIATATGTIGSRWAVLRADLNRGAQADIVASNTASRQKLIDRAKAWINHAGLYHHTWDEAAAELFGDGTMTPELAYLEDLEQTTRDRPGRHLYDQLLQASIARTAEHGPQEIPPDTSAPLYSLRQDTNARDHLEAEWNKTRPRGILAEQEAEAWQATAKLQYRAALAAKHTTDKETTCAPRPEPSASPSGLTPDASASHSSTPNSDSQPSASDNDGGADSNSTSNVGDSSVTSSDADDIPHFTPTGAPA